MTRVLRLLPLIALLAVTFPPAVEAAPGDPHAFCIDLPGDVDRGIGLGNNIFKLRGYPSIVLDGDLDWTEDPFDSPAWQSKLHNLRWTEDLIAAWEETGDPKYFTLWKKRLRDWWNDNRSGPRRSRFAWNKHAVAQRGFVYACALRYIDAVWLDEAMRRHGRFLDQDENYLGFGNHALNQNIGLFTLGCAVDKTRWMDDARTRLADLARTGIDDQGVNYEQSIEYQRYTRERYATALAVWDACGRTPPTVVVNRQPLMVDFLAHATLPSGRMVRLGDTPHRWMPPVAGTAVEFAATRGDRGPKPSAIRRLYDSGFAFARSGWGETRDFKDETYYALRFGPAPQGGHAHWEGTSLYLYAWGRPLLEDSGFGPYINDPWRDYSKSPRAHNRVVVDGVKFRDQQPVRLLGSTFAPTFEGYTLRTDAWGGSATTRRVIHSRTSDYLVVQDVVASGAPRATQQLWHLPPAAKLDIGHRTASTKFSRGNVALKWIGPAPTLDVLRAERRPLQGWIAYPKREFVPGRVIEARRPPDDQVRYLTLIVPWETEQPSIDVEVTQNSVRGFELYVTIDGVTEHVTVDGNHFSLS